MGLELVHPLLRGVSVAATPRPSRSSRALQRVRQDDSGSRWCWDPVASVRRLAFEYPNRARARGSHAYARNPGVGRRLSCAPLRSVLGAEAVLTTMSPENSQARGVGAGMLRLTRRCRARSADYGRCAFGA